VGVLPLCTCGQDQESRNLQSRRTGLLSGLMTAGEVK
jgi:hypothetical protein